MNRERLAELIVEALKARGGEATVLDVHKYIWHNYESDLRAAGNIFYTWQYDTRRAAEILRNKGIMVSAAISLRSIWQLI
jgi:hypothetical protein